MFKYLNTNVCPLPGIMLKCQNKAMPFRLFFEEYEILYTICSREIINLLLRNVNKFLLLKL